MHFPHLHTGIPGPPDRQTDGDVSPFQTASSAAAADSASPPPYGWGRRAARSPGLTLYVALRVKSQTPADRETFDFSPCPRTCATLSPSPVTQPHHPALNPNNHQPPPQETEMERPRRLYRSQWKGPYGLVSIPLEEKRVTHLFWGDLGVLAAAPAEPEEPRSSSPG